jgi:hypothetical protein
MEGETAAGPVITEASQTGADGIVFVKLEGSQDSRTIERTEWQYLCLLSYQAQTCMRTCEDLAALGVTLVDGKTVSCCGRMVYLTRGGLPLG